MNLTKFATLFLAYSETLQHDYYRLTHTPKGKCVIINIVNFHPSSQLRERKGAVRDGGNEYKILYQ